MNKFERVSYEQFKEGYYKCFLNCKSEGLEEYLDRIYSAIKLPVRATKDSAGYDFFTPISFRLEPGSSIVIPTGIRVRINEGWFLGLFPKSGLGTKYRLQLDNTTGIIDSGYYYSDNEGHIFAKITNDSRVANNTVTLYEGKAFMQGIFIPFGITDDDKATGIRNGGFGSTNS